MPRSTLGRAAFSAGVAVSLGFGVREAMAAPGTAKDLRPSCVDDADCHSICESLYPGQQVISDCSANQICYCALAN